jgi:hypothetical protein
MSVEIKAVLGIRDFYPFQIPDPKTATKERDEKIGYHIVDAANSSNVNP